MKTLRPSEIADLIIELYVDGRSVWLSDKENISRDNAVALAVAYKTLEELLTDKFNNGDDDVADQLLKAGSFAVEKETKLQ